MWRILVTLLVAVASMRETGLSAKFRNLTNRKMRLFWIDYAGKPYFNSFVGRGEETSFTTYPDHKFYW
jgi:hypothetical protein